MKLVSFSGSSSYFSGNFTEKRTVLNILCPFFSSLLSPSLSLPLSFSLSFSFASRCTGTSLAGIPGNERWYRYLPWRGAKKLKKSLRVGRVSPRAQRPTRCSQLLRIYNRAPDSVSRKVGAFPNRNLQAVTRLRACEGFVEKVERACTDTRKLFNVKIMTIVLTNIYCTHLF